MVTITVNRETKTYSFSKHNIGGVTYTLSVEDAEMLLDHLEFWGFDRV